MAAEPPPSAHLLDTLPLSLVMDESSGGASGDRASARARLCCSRLYSRSSASNVPGDRGWRL